MSKFVRSTTWVVSEVNTSKHYSSANLDVIASELLISYIARENVSFCRLCLSSMPSPKEIDSRPLYCLKKHVSRGWLRKNQIECFLTPYTMKNIVYHPMHFNKSWENINDSKNGAFPDFLHYFAILTPLSTHLNGVVLEGFETAIW